MLTRSWPVSVLSIKPATALHGLRVLVTRANTQAKPLCQMIEKSGGKALHYPMLALQATPSDPSIAHANEHLSHYDKLIFISANAVDFGLAVLDQQALNASQAQLACVGQQTANALAQQGYDNILHPVQDFSSEGLLRLSAFQDVKTQRILIVRGKGGKEQLKQVLEQRGAEVDYLECYQRLLPAIDYAPLRQSIREQAIDVISCSSNQALDNLLLAAPEPLLYNIAFLPISAAMATKAKTAGFNHVINTAINASDGAILEALHHFKKEALP